MSPNLREVTLPGGGRALVRVRLTHEQDAAVEASSIDYWDAMPDDVLAEIEERKDASVAEIAAAAKKLRGARGYGAVTRAADAMKTAQIRACVADWEGVSDPDGNALAWPAGLPGLSSADFDVLHMACVSAVLEGRADPNAGSGPSASPSRAVDPIPGGPSPSEKPGT
jgi:hypothetical protein